MIVNSVTEYARRGFMVHVEHNTAGAHWFWVPCCRYRPEIVAWNGQQWVSGGDGIITSANIEELDPSGDTGWDGVGLLVHLSNGTHWSAAGMRHQSAIPWPSRREVRQAYEYTECTSWRGQRHCGPEYFHNREWIRDMQARDPSRFPQNP